MDDSLSDCLMYRCKRCPGLDFTKAEAIAHKQYHRENPVSKTTGKRPRAQAKLVKPKGGGTGVCADICKKLYESKVHADLAIKASNGAIVKCHKSVLAVRSPVFAAMLKSKLKESETQLIEMDDMTEECVEAFLEFLYLSTSSQASKKPEVALGLLQAGHKYAIGPMEEAMIQLFLAKTEYGWFRASVTLQLFAFARRIDGCEDVKQKCATILRTHKAVLVTMELFKELLKEDPQVAVELGTVASSD